MIVIHRRANKIMQPLYFPESYQRNRTKLLFISILCVFIILRWCVITNDSKNVSESKEPFQKCECKGPDVVAPTTEYEQLRRRIRANIVELNKFYNAELNKIFTQKPQLKSQINKVFKMGTEQKNALLNDMDNLKKNDGYQQWRQTEHKNLGDLVQRRLNYLQNPADCKNARKLVCRIEQKNFGFGSEMHRLVFCFIMAYATERTLIINSNGWSYNKNDWEGVFQPVSDTCVTSDGVSRAIWSESQNDTQVVDIPFFKKINVPPAIPEDLAPRLIRLHGYPLTWWIGQFFKYLLQFQPKTQSMIDETIRRIGFKTPIVGVHIRRTDKITYREAESYNVEEYMKHVDEYFDRLEMVGKMVKRRIFLASDEPKVIDEARSKYPNYEIINNAESSRTANLSTRYTDASGYGILLDIHLLYLSDYIVCTFSSNVCRMVYELMQVKDIDAINRFISLDRIYHINGFQTKRKYFFKAILPHNSKNPNEMSMNVGDLVKLNPLKNNISNSFLKGRNLQTNKTGLFPKFKVIDEMEIAKFPRYSNVN